MSTKRGLGVSLVCLFVGLGTLLGTAGIAGATAPIITAGSDVSYVLSASAVTVDPSLTITEPNGVSDGDVWINSPIAGDVLSYTIPNGLSLTVTQNNAANYEFVGPGTAAQYQALYRSFSFESTSGTAGPRTVNWYVYESGDGTSNTPTSTVEVSGEPVLTAGGTATYDEGLSPAVVDSGVTVSDPSSSTLVSATVSITSNLQSSDDVLSFTNDGSTMGNITGIYDSTSGVLTLTSVDSSATLAQWQAALRSAAFSTTSTSISARTISWSVNDGSNNSVAVTSTMDVVDLPVLTAGDVASYTQGQSAVVADSGVTVSDLSASTLASATVSITGNFQSSLDVLSFTNDGSTMGNVVGSYGSTSGVLTLTTAGSTATLAQWQAALRSATFSTTSTSISTRTISWLVNDASNDSAAVTSTMDSVGLPVVTAGSTASYTEGHPAVVADAGLTVSDSSFTTLTLAAVLITSNFQTDADVLVFSNDGSTMGAVVGSYNPTTGVLFLTNSGHPTTLAQWQAALSAVTFSTTSTSTAPRTLSWSVDDGINHSSPVFSTMDIVAVPALTAGATADFVVGGAGMTADSGLSVSDPSSSDLASATVSITSGLQTGSDLLAFTNDGSTMGNVAGSYDSTTGVLSLTSSSHTATLAEWQAALDSVTFSTTSFTISPRTISWSANDGNNASAAVTSAMDVSVPSPLGGGGGGGTPPVSTPTTTNPSPVTSVPTYVLTTSLPKNAVANEGHRIVLTLKANEVTQVLIGLFSGKRNLGRWKTVLPRDKMLRTLRMLLPALARNAGTFRLVITARYAGHLETQTMTLHLL